MNLALGALIILIILLPGIIFRLFLIKSESFENPLDTSKLAEIAYIIIPTIFFNYFGVVFIENFLNYTVNYEQLYHLILGDDSSILDFDNIITPSIPKFLKYIGILCFISGLFGYLLKRIILMFNLDLKYSVFTISNEWDILLSGRLLKHEYKSIFIHNFKKVYFKEVLKYCKLFIKGKMTFKKLKKYVYYYYARFRKINFDFVQIDLLVSVANSEIIYNGTLKKYYLGKNNTIDKIYLMGIQKKEHIVDCNTSTQFDEIESDILVFKGENIININVNYLTLG